MVLFGVTQKITQPFNHDLPRPLKNIGHDASKHTPTVGLICSLLRWFSANILRIALGTMGKPGGHNKATPRYRLAGKHLPYMLPLQTGEISIILRNYHILQQYIYIYLFMNS